MNRRAQAALEYLVTYGWALLAILVAVGAFAYLGLLDTQRYLPERCDFGAQLECLDFAILKENPSFPPVGYVRVRLRNNFGEDINVTSVWISENGESGIQLLRSDGTIIPGGVLSFIITAGNYSDVQLNFGAGYGHPEFFTPGERSTIPLTFEFQRHAQNAPSHNVSGTVFGTVQ